MNQRQPTTEPDIGPWVFVIIGLIVLLAVLIALAYLNALAGAEPLVRPADSIFIHQRSVL
jgi:hypothetical protein